MPTKEPGYVYILTNPSFREDWVKIGKSSRPVDVRSKELDNTAVPLPFEIYATMKTVKYNEAEKLVHRYIERFTNLRIRNNREFFNVNPEEALDIFKEVAMLLDDALIEVFDEPKGCENKSTQPSEKKRGNGQIFYHEYWDAFVDYMKNNPSNFFRTPNATYDNWMNIAIGRSGFNVVLILNKKQQKATIQFYMYDDADKKHFDALLPFQEKAETNIGEKLTWRRMDDRKGSAIELYRQSKISEPSQWEEIFKWYRTYTEKFVTFFKPLVKKL